MTPIESVAEAGKAGGLRTAAILIRKLAEQGPASPDVLIAVANALDGTADGIERNSMAGLPLRSGH